MSFVVLTALLAAVTAVACSLPGVFVVLRKSSMLVEGMGHAVFPGIVIGFFFAQDLSSPWLVLGAAIAGVIVVIGNELLARTGLLSGDAAQGLIFPALFSLGVIITTTHFSHLHLDEHAVLVGDFNLATFKQLTVGGVSIGPKYVYLMAAVAVVNALLLAICYRPLKISTFDPEFARTQNIPVTALNIVFMFSVSLTVTAGFAAAGAILIVALVVVPAATAYLFARTLKQMIVWTLIIAVSGALLGFWVSYELDAATSAGIATFYGLMFTAVFVLRRITTARTRHAAASGLDHHRREAITA